MWPTFRLWAGHLLSVMILAAAVSWASSTTSASGNCDHIADLDARLDCLMGAFSGGGSITNPAPLQQPQNAQTTTDGLSDDQIKQLIIQQSIASYPGNCPCPYNRARNGSQCGKRSAWSKAGGYAPVCYPEEVTPDMISAFRNQL